MRRHEERIGHLRNYDPEALKAMIEATGLTVIRMYQWGWPFFSPLYRNLQAAMGARTHDIAMGRFSIWQKMLCHALYGLFCLNRHTRGDQLVILAERRLASA